LFLADVTNALYHQIQKMPRQNLMHLVLGQFNDQNPRDFAELIAQVRIVSTDDVSVSDIKSAVLGLLRRQDLILTDDSKLMRPLVETVAA
jgi:hypothetical protein